MNSLLMLMQRETASQIDNSTRNGLIRRIDYIKHFIVIPFALTSMLLSQAAWSLEVTQGPSIVMDPNGVTPLAGVVQLTTDVPSRTRIAVSNGIDSWTREFAEFETEHSVPVLGLKPNSSYSVEVTIVDEVGESMVLLPALEAVTDQLPADFPNISVLHSNPTMMKPGFTLLDRINRGLGDTPDRTLPTYSIILDNAGEVVWYSTAGWRDMEQLQNGNLTYFRGAGIFDEMDLLGNIQQSVEFDAGLIHHDVSPTSTGTQLSLTRESVVVEGYPTNYNDPNAPTQTVSIEDNPIVEFSPEGDLLHTWRLTDMLDPTRIGFHSLYQVSNGDLDWAHANAVLYDPSDDSIIVSVRHQDAIIKFLRSSGELKWILANHDNWPDDLQPFLLSPIGAPFEWHYHAHAPMITASGTLLLFDNGNNRASPFDGREPIQDGENYSRAVEYMIDEENMEVQQVWEYGTQANQIYYSASVGDADSVNSTDNVLITYGDIRYVDGVSSADLGMGSLHTRIIEVDHNTPAQKVFEVAIYNTTPGSHMKVYRSERIPDLYPLDTDGDGVPDYQDNCVLHTNGPIITDAGGNSQRDTNNDGFGNACDADLNNDGQTNSLDLGLFRQVFFTTESQPGFDPDADLNGDGAVNSLDLGIVKTLFMQPPGPSATAP
jgi:arylsulfate sulfotransferase